MDFQKKLEYIGSLNQLFSVKQYIFTDGKKNGIKAIDIGNGVGLELTLLADKGLDIYNIRYKGKNLNYLTPSDVVSPKLYDSEDFLWSFAAGFLTTCGLTSIAVPCEDAFGKTVTHGRISNTPAEQVTVVTELVDGIPTATISGIMTEAVLFGYHLSLKRTIVCKYGCNEIQMTDVVTNKGYRKTPHMILYHFNMGYPLLSEAAKLTIDHHSIRARTDYAQTFIEDWNKITPPVPNIEEMCYYHDVRADPEGMAKVGLENPAEGLKMELSFDKKVLDHFVQWKMLGQGEYVMGLEPANATIDGRDDALANGSLKFLEAGESVTYTFKINILDLGEVK